jgi:hypothetical protein
MTLVYKYLTDEQHAREFVDEGTIKVGTLYGYAVAELGVRSDDLEGTHSQSVEQEVPVWDPVLDALWAGNTFSRTNYSQDCYVYCTALELTSTAAAGRPWCVEISDIETFADIVHAALQVYHKSELRRFVRPVIYRSRSEGTVPSPNDLAFVKDAGKFAFERELRAVFFDPTERRPFHRLVAPPTVSIKQLIPMVRRVAIP